MKTTVIGTGIMGAGMAGSLARDGHQVTIWNRTPDKAEAVADAIDADVTVAATVADAVADCEVVVTILFDAEAVLAVADDIAAHLPDGSVWVQSATVGPNAARTIADRAPGRVLDAPVLGTRKPAEDGTLVVLASGPADLVEAARPALDAIGGRTLVVGDEIGQGSALKLACNAWVGLLTAGTAQALALARGLGVDPQLFLDAIDGGAADSPYAHLKGGAMLSGDMPVSFALDGVRKDFALMQDAAGGAGVDDELIATVRGLFDAAAELGHGGDDLASVWSIWQDDRT
jgi:3-hydroxyisobutyrate dehydrogenase